MVLWELTLVTAYFLGLKRTYRLALKIQRSIFSPKHPKILQFAQRRTRAAFDIALMVHRNIQQRDLEVGRNLGNWILRWLDKMRPAAEIRGSRVGNFTPKRNLDTNTKKQLTSSPRGKTPGSVQKFSTYRNSNSSRRLFASSNYSGITMIMRPTNGSNIQYRRLSSVGPEEVRRHNNFRVASGGVIREDIMQWMLQKGKSQTVMWRLCTGLCKR